uniref:Uncharacterized protein n=1 Tax=Athene cunicularia TaxID=194338 RepID=A0A663M5W6_ATHCN
GSLPYLWNEMGNHRKKSMSRRALCSYLNTSTYILLQQKILILSFYQE